MKTKMRLLSVVVALFLTVTTITSAVLPIWADSRVVTTNTGSETDFPVEAGDGSTLIQAVYTAEQLGEEAFPIRAVSFELAGLPEIGIWCDVELYLVSVPTGTTLDTPTAWRDQYQVNPVFYDDVVLTNGALTVPVGSYFEYDGESDLLVSLTLDILSYLDSTAYLKAATGGTSLYANSMVYLDVWDADLLADTVGTPVDQVPAVTFMEEYDFDIMIVSSKGGSVKAVPTGAGIGDIVELTATPEPGYDFMGYRVYSSNGYAVPVTGDTFEMPGSDVYVTGYFRNILDGEEFFRYADAAPEASLDAYDAPFRWGIEIPAADIAMMGYETLTEIGFWFVREYPGAYALTVKVDGETVYDKIHNMSGKSGWYYFDLDAPVALDGTQDVGIYLFTQDIPAPGAFSPDHGNPHAGLIWEEHWVEGQYYGNFWDARLFGMPLTWMIGAGFAWEIPTYTVTLKANNGTDAQMTADRATIRTAYDTPACPFTNPYKTFGGWSLTPDGEPITFPTQFDDDTELYAVWQDTYSTISFDANGGTGEMADVTAVIGSTYSLPACGFTAPAHKQFAGWAYADGTLATDFTVTDNVTLMPVWDDVLYTISFNANGGVGIMADVTVISGSTYSLPACGFTAPEYGTFRGWALTADGDVITNTVTVGGNTVLYAVWEIVIPAPTSFTVSFNANGGSGHMDAVAVTADDVFTVPGCGFTAPNGLFFAGWTLADGTPVESFAVVADTVLFASWETESDAAHRWAIEAGMFNSESELTGIKSFTAGEFWYRLWLLYGAPVATLRTMYFTDVPADAYYYEAVLWALQNKIIITPATRLMGADEIMSRQMVIMVTFAVAGKLVVADPANVHFIDTYYVASYIKALDWAVETDVVTDSGEKFRPHADATMSQAVLWLYRTIN